MEVLMGRQGLHLWSTDRQRLARLLKLQEARLGKGRKSGSSTLLTEG